MKLNLNDTFKVTGGGHGKRVYTVVGLQTGIFDLECNDQYGEVCFFSNRGLEIYESLGQFVMIERAVEAEAIANAKAALESDHVQSVEVGFEDEFDGTRFYSAVTYDTGIPHHYTVKVWEENGATMAHCNCIAESACRHILKVAVEDAKRCKRKVYVESFSNYRAHKSRKSAGIKQREEPCKCRTDYSEHMFILCEKHAQEAESEHPHYQL